MATSIYKNFNFPWKPIHTILFPFLCCAISVLYFNHVIILSNVCHFSPQVQRLVSGTFDNVVDHVTIIDCRYPYEYQAGHIKVAHFVLKQLSNITYMNATNNALRKYVYVNTKRGAAATILSLTHLLFTLNNFRTTFLQ